MDIILKLSHFLYALPIITHRYLHFIYASFAAVTIPAWFPWHLLQTFLVGIVIIATALIKTMHPVFYYSGMRMILYRR